MSLVNPDNEKVVLPRGPQLWEVLEREWARGSRRRWKRLAIVQLHVYCGWHFEMIGRAFGNPKGHVVRTFHRTVRELASQFTYAPPFLDSDGQEVISGVTRTEFLQAPFEFVGPSCRSFGQGLPQRDADGRFLKRSERKAA
jgi:hypothetical protein